jgi:hypothetical protein
MGKSKSEGLKYITSSALLAGIVVKTPSARSP